MPQRQTVLIVFPMSVGMNRSWPVKSANWDCVPHVCGDEPQTKNRSAAKL